MLKYIKEYNQFNDDEDIWNDFLKYYNERLSHLSHINIPDDREIEEDGLSSSYLNKRLTIEFWRMLPMDVGSSNLDKETAIQMIDHSYADYHTADGIYGILTWIKTYNDYKNKGGELYRLVYLKDPKDLNLDKLGNHWTYEEYVLRDFYHGYMENYYTDLTKGKDAYIITAKIPPNLNIEVGSFDRPEEQEIYIPDSDQSKIDLIKISKI